MPVIQTLPPQTSPPECNCTALRKAARHVSLLYDRALAPSGLGANQFGILAELNRQAAPVSLARLAKALVMDRSALGHNLRPLEREALVALGTAAGDRRSRAITLTPAGRERLMLARPYWQAAQDRFQAALGASGATALREMLKATIGADYGDAA